MKYFNGKLLMCCEVFTFFGDIKNDLNSRTTTWHLRKMASRRHVVAVVHPSQLRSSKLEFRSVSVWKLTVLVVCDYAKNVLYTDISLFIHPEPVF